MATTPTTPPDIEDLSTPPNRLGTSDTVFVAAVDTFFSELPTFGTEQNTLADWTYSTAGEVYTNALEAEQSATNAADSATEASVYSDASQSSANFKGLWSTATGAATVPSVYSHNGLDWQLLVNLPNIAASEPGVTSDWEVVYKFKGIANEIADPLCHLLATNQPVVKSPQNLLVTRPSAQNYTDRYGVTQTAPIDTIREEKDGYLSAAGVSEQLAVLSDNTIPDLSGEFSIAITANNLNIAETGVLRYLWQVPVNETTTATQGLFLAKTASAAFGLARLSDVVDSASVNFSIEENPTIVVVKDATSLKVYCNGALAGSALLGSASVTLDTTKNVKIGGRLADTNNNANCNLKNFKTFDKALTPSQVLAIS